MAQPQSSKALTDCSAVIIDRKDVEAVMELFGIKFSTVMHSGIS